MGRTHGFDWNPSRMARLQTLRADGFGYHQIATVLGSEWGVTLTASQCNSAVNGRRRNAPQGLPERRVVADPARDAAPAVRSGDGTLGDLPGVAPVVHTPQKTNDGNRLWISDLQLPFADPRALKFCQDVRRDYNIPLTNIGCVGDEVDLYWASRYPKSPDARYTPNQETDAARLELERWWHAFPYMLICDSNHRGRAEKALARGGIPARFLADLRTVFGTPDGWRWQSHWIIDGGKHRYRAEHGHKRPLGHAGLRMRPLWRQMSTLWGHEHKEPATIHLNTDAGQRIWGMRVGSLMDREINEANQYAAEDAGMPALSVGVVLDGGRTPLVVHM